MASQLPNTDSPSWLLRAASKLEKDLYRKISYKYRVKIKDLKTEIERLLRKGEQMQMTFQDEVKRLKAELGIKDKRCGELYRRVADCQTKLLDYEMSTRDIVWNESDEEEQRDVEKGKQNEDDVESEVEIGEQNSEDDIESEDESGEQKSEESEVVKEDQNFVKEKQEIRSVAITLPWDRESEKLRRREIEELTNLREMAPDPLITAYPLFRARHPLGSPKNAHEVCPQNQLIPHQRLGHL